MADRTDFGTFGRYRETPVADMPADMKDAYDFTKSLRGLVPGRIASGSPIPGCRRLSFLSGNITRSGRH
jgi:hypothetical protein